MSDINKDSVSCSCTKMGDLSESLVDDLSESLVEENEFGLLSEAELSLLREDSLKHRNIELMKQIFNIRNRLIVLTEELLKEKLLVNAKDKVILDSELAKITQQQSLVKEESKKLLKTISASHNIPEEGAGWGYDPESGAIIIK